MAQALATAVSQAGTVAIDGKGLRTAVASVRDGPPLALVNAFASASGLALGQVGVPGGTSEIAALRELLALLELKGQTVTADAIHCQRETARAIVDKGAHYLFAFKANRFAMYDDALLYLDNPVTQAGDAAKTVTARRCAARSRTGARRGRPACRLSYAHEAGLVLAALAVETKGNEITAIPELLDMLALDSAVVTIDAIGTQKAIAAKKGDYLLACKENQPALHADIEEFFADPALAKECANHRETDAGHGRIEERCARAADAGWLSKRHPQWKGLQSIAAIDCLRRDKKTGATSKETRFYISSLAPDPARLLAASRAHWSIENNLHWTLDVAFGEDDGRTRKDYSALNLAIIRHAALMLKQEPTKIPIKRKRVKAAINPDFRAALLQC